MKWSFGKTIKGQIGVAFIDGGLTIGQCNWRNGQYVSPKIYHVEQGAELFTSESYRDAIHEAKVSGSDCIVSLPSSILHHQILRLPEMQITELKEAVSWEMAERLGIKRNELQTDAIAIGKSGEVLGFAIEKNVLEGILDPMYAVGLRPTCIQANGISLCNTFSMLHRRESDQNQVRSILNFGSLNSSLLIIEGNRLAFFKSLSFKGVDLRESIKKHTGVTFSQATQMLDSTRVNNSDLEICKAVRDATRSFHEEIAVDVVKCLRHYGVTNRAPLSSCLCITGSEGCNQFLAEILSNACNQEVLADHQLDHINTVPNEILSIPGWNVVFGASLAKLHLSPKVRDNDAYSKAAA